MNIQSPIGVMDSGIGGLSVAMAIRDTLPQENILYFGDTANCPYGNKTREELLALSTRNVAFLQSRGAKCIALACNTTSSLADELRTRFSVPIITVAECAADAIAASGAQQVGLIATVFTVQSGIYEKRIHALAPELRVVSAPSRNLARLIESQADDAELDDEIRQSMAPILAEPSVRDVILGCTHYPLVLARFRAVCPGLRFLDPAPYQAQAVAAFLAENGLQNREDTPQFTVCTTGDPAAFREICKTSGISEHYRTEFIHIDF